MNPSNGERDNFKPPRFDQRPCRNLASRRYAYADADQRALAYVHVAAQVRSGSDVGVVLHDAIVIHGSAGIDDDVAPDPRSRLHHSASHNDRTSPYDGVLGDPRILANQHWETHVCIG